MTIESLCVKCYAKYKSIYDEFIKLYDFSLENLPGEIWRWIPDYEELYQGSNFGRVKSFKYKEPRILTPALNSGGYLFVRLCKAAKAKNLHVSRLVGELFIPNPEGKPEVNHLHGRFNNYVGSLEWATGSENQKHACDTGLQKSGTDDSQALLTAKQVVYIRNNPDGLTLEQLAEMFCVDYSTIGRILRE